MSGTPWSARLAAPTVGQSDDAVAVRAGLMFAALCAAVVEHDGPERSVLERIAEAPAEYRASCVTGGAPALPLSDQPTVRGFEIAAVVAAIIASTVDGDCKPVVERVCASMGIGSEASSLVLEPSTELRALLQHRVRPVRPLGPLAWRVCDAVLTTSPLDPADHTFPSAVGRVLTGVAGDASGTVPTTIERLA